MSFPAVEPFEALRSALDSAGVRFAVGGSWASSAYGESRLTNDIDILVDLSLATLSRFLELLPAGFYVDPDNCRDALRRGRAFNVLYVPSPMKFDLFPARAYPLGIEELDRAVLISKSGLSEAPVPFVSPEDILLAKLNWFREGGEVSDRQWRDIEGIVRTEATSLDFAYLTRGAAILGVGDLLKRALEIGGRYTG